jgi:hypothetical protein
MSLGDAEAGRVFGGIPSPVIVVSWVWLGVSALLLLYLRGILPATWIELVWFWRFRDLWFGPTHFGLSLQQAVMLVNPLLVILLWVRFRSPSWWWARRAPIKAVPYVGTACVLLVVQWAFYMVGEALPRWYLIQLHP